MLALGAAVCALAFDAEYLAASLQPGSGDAELDGADPEYSPHTPTENDDHSTALELCPVADFKIAAEKVSKELPGTFEKVGGVNGLVDFYAEQAAMGKRQCMNKPMENNANYSAEFEFWPEASSGKKDTLIYNLAEGTTGTRSLDCMMQALNYNTRHGMACTQFENDCTREYDLYEYVSDTPIASHVAQLLATHPKAPAFLTIRDPDDWLRMRLQNLLKNGQPEDPLPINFEGADAVRMAAPCGMVQLQMNSYYNARRGRLLFDTWTTCLASGRNGRTDNDLWLVNVFKGHTLNNSITTHDSNAQVAEQLYDFAQKNSVLQGRMPSKERIAGALDDCFENAIHLR